jgi:hypothetical protein
MFKLAKTVCFFYDRKTPHETNPFRKASFGDET